MMQPRALFAVATAALVAGLVTQEICSADPPSGTGKAKPVYSVSEYNPKRNPAEDLAETVAIAKKDNRRILLLIGGDW